MVKITLLAVIDRVGCSPAWSAPVARLNNSARAMSPMIKAAAVLFLILSVVLFASVGMADARLLEITSGQAFESNDFEPHILVTGPGFIWGAGSRLGNIPGEPVTGMRVQTYRLIVDGVTYIDLPGCCPFFSNPDPLTFVAVFDGPHSLASNEYTGPYTTTFTMTGTIPEFGFDLVGQGLYTEQLFPPTQTSPGWNAVFRWDSSRPKCQNPRRRCC